MHVGAFTTRMHGYRVQIDTYVIPRADVRRSSTIRLRYEIRGVAEIPPGPSRNRLVSDRNRLLRSRRSPCISGGTYVQGVIHSVRRLLLLPTDTRLKLTIFVFFLTSFKRRLCIDR